VAGIAQSKFQAQQQGQLGEKTAEERTEEEIVTAYIKRQSLLEKHDQDKRKGRATATEEKDGKDLQKALKLRMLEHEPSAKDRYEEPFRI
jgi:hypothetical protein